MVGAGSSKGGVNAERGRVHCRVALTSTVLRKAPYRTARCLLLEAVPWETRRTEFQGGG